MTGNANFATLERYTNPRSRDTDVKRETPWQVAKKVATKMVPSKKVVSKKVVPDGVEPSSSFH
jgi:hypothetical protein